MHPAGVTTPPETPTRSDSVMSTHTKIAQVLPVSPNATQARMRMRRDGIIEYCTTNGLDYEVLQDKKLGAGRFSQVYLARRVDARPLQANVEFATPPTTPTSPQPRHPGLGSTSTVFAVKVAVDKSSIKTLRGEARVLSHLCMDCDSKQYIVPFHGFDFRINSLVFTALPSTLEDMVVRELENIDPASRTTKLTAILPHVARSLTSSLAWMHAAGVVHADIKPVNILLRADVPVSIPLADGQFIMNLPFTPVFADFTSSFLISDDSKTISSVGGGTYD